MKKNIKLAETLVEALPYIKKFNSKIIVIKYGGSIGSKDFINFTRDVVLMKLLGLSPILVHGGGLEISKELEKNNIESKFINGLRVTCKKTMKIVENVLFKKINKQIVRMIIQNGGKSTGVSGNKLNMLRVKKFTNGLNGADIGRVGEITSVNKKLIKKYIKNDMIPVITPIGINQKGETFNINADHAAAKIASCLKAEKLIILTDVEGIIDNKNKLISSINKKNINKLIKDGVIQKGMVPKVKNMINALSEGVNKAHIIDGRTKNAIILEMFTDSGIGTEILL
ncbi:acetylglutamate kinase [bacterium]|nr:acetylglutamate kinase [bacterium]|tara:strand:- start:3256 stop:4107 length:852 start_codon:yes stop_codon:yes gene_type:complete